MGKKGLSLEEKRKKMLEILYETKDFYLLKELEKIAPKKKGIIANVFANYDAATGKKIEDYEVVHSGLESLSGEKEPEA